MKCYVYSIVNNISKQRYVGQTTNYYRRKEEHLSKLRENRHPNPKLQSAWNKYGEENFTFEKECFDISKKELDDKEKEYIKRYNSFINGYNLTEGGTGGNTKINRVLDFEKFCFAYFGNKKYEILRNENLRLKIELEKYKEETKDFAKSEEDVLSYALFPQVAKKFFDVRDGRTAAPAAPAAKTDSEVREVFVRDLS